MFVLFLNYDKNNENVQHKDSENAENCQFGCYYFSDLIKCFLKENIYDSNHPLLFQLFTTSSPPHKPNLENTDFK